MTNAQAGALASMQAANAALTPDERKARSHAASKASRDAALARKRGAAATGGDQPKQTATTKARAVEVVVHAWRVCLRTDAGNAWVCVQAPGMQRAGKAARKAHKGATVLGVVREGVLPGTVVGMGAV